MCKGTIWTPTQKTEDDPRVSFLVANSKEITQSKASDGTTSSWHNVKVQG